jgi:hypothetical protein
VCVAREKSSRFFRVFEGQKTWQKAKRREKKQTWQRAKRRAKKQLFDEQKKAKKQKEQKEE